MRGLFEWKRLPGGKLCSEFRSKPDFHYRSIKCDEWLRCFWLLLPLETKVTRLANEVGVEMGLVI